MEWYRRVLRQEKRFYGNNKAIVSCKMAIKSTLPLRFITIAIFYFHPIDRMITRSVCHVCSRHFFLLKYVFCLYHSLSFYSVIQLCLAVPFFRWPNLYTIFYNVTSRASLILLRQFLSIIYKPNFVWDINFNLCLTCAVPIKKTKWSNPSKLILGKYWMSQSIQTSIQ